MQASFETSTAWERHSIAGSSRSASVRIWNANTRETPHGSRQYRPSTGPKRILSTTLHAKPSAVHASCSSTKAGLVDRYSLRSSEDTERRYMLRVAAMCAESLYHTTVLLGEVAKRPVCKAVAIRGPLHFLSDWYSHSGDDAGAQRCAGMGASVRATAPYLHWGAVLPWIVLPLIKVPRQALWLTFRIDSPLTHSAMELRHRILLDLHPCRLIPGSTAEDLSS
jgi:hypothetical protein